MGRPDLHPSRKPRAAPAPLPAHGLRDRPDRGLGRGSQGGHRARRPHPHAAFRRRLSRQSPARLADPARARGHGDDVRLDRFRGPRGRAARPGARRGLPDMGRAARDGGRPRMADRGPRHRSWPRRHGPPRGGAPDRRKPRPRGVDAMGRHARRQARLVPPRARGPAGHRDPRKPPRAGRPRHGRDARGLCRPRARHAVHRARPHRPRGRAAPADLLLAAEPDLGRGARHRPRPGLRGHDGGRAPQHRRRPS